MLANLLRRYWKKSAAGLLFTAVVSACGFALFVRYAKELIVPSAAVLAAIFAGACSGISKVQLQRSNKSDLWIWLSITMMCLMLAYHFPVREFYYDSSAQIEIGQATREAHFRVTTGQKSGAGIPNPPLFAYIMGGATRLTLDPKPITAVISFIHLLAIAGTLFYLSKSLPSPFAPLIALLMAASPGIILYANLLWEGSTLIPFSAVFHYLLYRFVSSPCRRYFIGATLVATLAAQSHQAGFFLYPVLGVVGLYYIRRLKLSGVIGALSLGMLLSAPYLYYMLVQGGLMHLGNAGSSGSSLHPVTVLFATMGVFSMFHCHYTYYNRDFSGFLDRSAGLMGNPLYVASLVITILFAAGWLAYLFYVARGRRLIGFRSAHEVYFPVPVQVAGLITTLVYIAYALFLPYIWFKHVIILFPSYFILAAWPAWRFWHNHVMRIVFAIGILGAAILMPLMFRNIDKMGGSLGRGAIQDYQLSYQTIEKIRDRIWAITPPDQYPMIYTSGYWQGPLQTVIFSKSQSDQTSSIPLFLNIRWSHTARRFLWDVYPLSAALKNYQQALETIGNQLPPNARVAISGVREYPLYGQRNEFRQWPDRIQTIPMDTNSLMNADYLVIDTFCPWATPQLKTQDVFEWVLNSSEFRLTAANEGVYLFARDARPRSSSLIDLLKDGLHFAEFRDYFMTGSHIADGSAPFGVTRIASPEQDRGEFLTYGPYVTLPEGRYQAKFRFHTDRLTEEPFLIFDVVAMGGRMELAHLSVREVQSIDSWNVAQLNFEIPPGGLDRVELRARYGRNAKVKLQAPKLQSLSD